MFARAAPVKPERRGQALVGGLVLAVLLGGGIGYLYFVKLRPLSAITSAATLSPDAVAAMARVRELEEQLAALQREKHSDPAGSSPVLRGELVTAGEPGVVPPKRTDEGRTPVPSAAKTLGRTAVVQVEALVDETGAVVDVRILDASISGFGFEAAAGKKVRQSRYRPATKNGVPVRMWVPISVRFTP